MGLCKEVEVQVGTAAKATLTCSSTDDEAKEEIQVRLHMRSARNGPVP